MKEINIARTIVLKRKEKGLTQEDLARYIGVSKASVSKWETGQSYPDITFLPQLAAFFNISIDDLMGYEPQMTKEDIRKLYLRLSADFVEKPFDEVLESCRDITKKYFSCFLLLFQIGALLVNNSMASGDMEKGFAVLEEAKGLFIRINAESDDADLCQQSLNMEAFIELTAGNPQQVIELVEGTNSQMYSPETLLAPAYQMVGRNQEAKAVLQIGIYQRITSLFSIIPDYLLLCTDRPEQFEETYRRTMAVMETFDLKRLHPSILPRFYIWAAHGYLTIGNMEKALDILEEYAGLVTGDIYPLHLKGDDFFDLLDSWFEDFTLGTALPRDEKIVRQSLLEGVEANPAFEPLANDSRFIRLLEKLRRNCQEGTV